MLTYTAPGADIVGQDAEVHLSLTLPYNKSTWLKKARAAIKYHYSIYLFNIYIHFKLLIFQNVQP